MIDTDLINKFGLPVALLLYFIYQNYKLSREYNAYIKDIASQTVVALDNSTKSLEKSTQEIIKNSAIIERINADSQRAGT